MYGYKATLLGLLITLVSSISNAAWLQPDETVRLDDHTAISYRLSKGDPSTTGFSSVKGVDLVLATGDKASRPLHIAINDDQNRQLSSQIYKISPGGKDHVWVLSRLGHRLSGAVWVNLNSGAIEKAFHGGGFSVSPSGDHLAWSFPGLRMLYHTVFVDGELVYPTAISGWEWGDLGSTPKLKSTGQYPSDVCDSETSSNLVILPIQWLDSETLSFVIEQAKTSDPKTDFAENSTFEQIVLTVKNGMLTTKSKKPISRENAQNWQRRLGE